MATPTQHKTQSWARWRWVNAGLESLAGVLVVSAVVFLLMLIDPARAENELKTAAPWLGWYWPLFGLHVIAALVIGATWTATPVFREMRRRRGRQETDECTT